MDHEFRPFHERTRIDIAVIVVLRSEWRAFCNVFKDHLKDFRSAALEDPSSPIEFQLGGYSVAAAFVNMGRPDDRKIQGKIAAATFMGWFLSRYEPKTLAIIGIAAGMRASSKGDVVVGTHVYDPVEDSEVVSDGDRKPRIISGLPPIPMGKLTDKMLNCFPHGQDGKRIITTKEIGIASTLQSFELRAGGIVTVGSVAKTIDYIEENEKANRRISALEMESFAVFSATNLLLQHQANFVCIRAISDEGGEDKADIDSDSNDEDWRQRVSERAFYVFKTAIHEKVFDPWTQEYLPPQATDAPDAEHTGAFPFFVREDLIDPLGLQQMLIGDTGEKRSLTALHEFLACTEPDVPGRHEHQQSLFAILNGSTELTSVTDVLVKILNNSLWHTLAANDKSASKLRAAFDRLHENGKARKIFPAGDTDSHIEHTRATKSRILIEYVVNSIAPKTLRTSPIVTCLVERTASRIALEEIKKKFEVNNRVVIDFDAVSLAELYEQTEWELIKEQQQIYDIVFTYHLHMGIIGAKARLSGHQPTPKLQNDTANVFSSVRQEIANTEGETIDSPRPGFAPINANTLVLLINRELCDTYADEFEWFGGDGDFPTQNWDQINRILNFFKDKKGRAGICMCASRLGDCAYFEWLAVCTSLGARVFLKDYGWQPCRRHELRVNSDDIRKATEAYIALRTFHPNDRLHPCDTDVKQQSELFCKGDIPLAIVWSDMLDFYWRELGRKLQVSALPGDRSVIGVGICCVNSRAKGQHVADEFVEYLQEITVQQQLSKAGWCSPYTAGFSSEILDDRPYLAAVAKALNKQGGAMEASKKSELVRRVIGDGLNDMLRGNVGVERALRAMESEIALAIDYD